MQLLSGVSELKIVYERATDSLYFVNSTLYPLHFNFAKDVLGYSKSHPIFDQEQYFQGGNPEYRLATLNYLHHQNIYTLEFFPGDPISPAGIQETWDKVKASVWFKSKLYLYLNAESHLNIVDQLNNVSLITTAEIYAGQNYQGLNEAEAYGFLKIKTLAELESDLPSRHDIIVTNGVPLDLPVVSGIITTAFQGYLSHINILSGNRGTPNMALRDAFESPLIAGLEDQLVYLKVMRDQFEIRPATLAEAEAFWNLNNPSGTLSLACNDSTPGLIFLEDLNHSMSDRVGAKAANFGELEVIRSRYGVSFKLPEAALAIPFYYYSDHMHSHGLNAFKDSLMALSQWKNDASFRSQSLQALQDSILRAALNPELLQQLELALNADPDFRRFRFRSSTNAEDIAGFNGAGLYTSATADLDDPQLSIELAVKTVWASLWRYRANEEREYFNIDPNTVAMGVLIHRSFPAEHVNGVALTHNITDPEYPAHTVEVQAGETSVVNPPAGVTNEQFLFYLLRGEQSYTDIDIQYLSESNIISHGRVMNTLEILNLMRTLDAIKSHYYNNYRESYVGSYYAFALDVEFKLEGAGRELYLKQVRPFY
jgi:hypothetical protein